MLFLQIPIKLATMLSNASLQRSVQIHAAEILRTILKEESTQVDLQDILRLERYPQVRSMLFALLYLKWLEESARLSSTYFNYHAPSVQVHKYALLEELSNSIQMSRSTFENLLADAIWLTVWLSSDRRAFMGELFYFTPREGIRGVEFKELEQYVIYQDTQLQKAFAAIEPDQSLTQSTVEGVLDSFEDEAHQQAYDGLIASELPYLIKPSEKVVAAPPVSTKPAFGKSFVHNLTVLATEEEPAVAAKKPETKQEAVDTAPPTAEKKLQPTAEEPVSIESSKPEEQLLPEPAVPLEGQTAAHEAPTNASIVEVELSSDEEVARTVPYRERKQPETTASEVPESEEASTLLDQIRSNVKVERGLFTLQDRFRFKKYLFDNNEIDFERATQRIRQADQAEEAIVKLTKLYSQAYSWDDKVELVADFEFRIRAMF